MAAACPRRRLAIAVFMPRASPILTLVRKAVQANELYIFTHPDMRPPLEMRVDRFLAAYRKLGAGPQEIKR